MANEGSFSARAYSSNSYIPINDAYITVTKPKDGEIPELIAFLKTNSSGQTNSILFPAPNAINSQFPEGEGAAFSTFDATVYQPLYFTIVIKNVQIFDGNRTSLPFELIPIPEDQNPAKTVESIDITPQNL